MKTIKLASLAGFLLLFGAWTSVRLHKNFDTKNTVIQTLKATEFPQEKKLSEYKKTDFAATLEHELPKGKNVVYAATLLFAWDGIKTKLNTPLNIQKSFKDLVLLNESKSFLNTLKENEYTVKTTIKEQNITSIAEFRKMLPFTVKLENFDKKLNFKGKKVLCFGLSSKSDFAARQEVEVLYYNNDNDFIVKLKPKDAQHEIILYKNTAQKNTSLAEMNEDLTKKIAQGKAEQKIDAMKWKYGIGGADELIIPKFSFNIKHNYPNLVGNKFTAQDTSYVIGKAEQTTAFTLDETGATAYSRAEIQVCGSVYKAPTKTKKMKFDQPFLLLLKRVESQNPYLAVWADNAELMQK
jgi:hypothetical protein